MESIVRNGKSVSGRRQPLANAVVAVLDPRLQSCRKQAM
jgi:hypothetical protein